MLGYGPKFGVIGQLTAVAKSRSGAAPPLSHVRAPRMRRPLVTCLTDQSAAWLPIWAFTWARMPSRL